MTSPSDAPLSNDLESLKARVFDGKGWNKAFVEGALIHDLWAEIERLGRDRDAYKREADQIYREVTNLRAEVSSLKRELLRVQKSSDRCTCAAAATDPYCRFHGGM